jgi:hypothetical protein
MDTEVLVRYGRTCFVALFMFSGSGWGQATGRHLSNEEYLQLQIDSLQTQIQQMKSELDKMRNTKGGAKDANERNVDPSIGSPLDTKSLNGQPVSAGSADVASLREDLGLLSQKVDDQDQTKIESSSRYRVRLSGMFLVNFFGNRGTVDNIENPALPIIPPLADGAGSFGGTIRQTQLGLKVVGPDLLGARTSGDVEMDFAGGFSDSPGGSTVGLPRLRTGTVRLDWKRTSVIAGQDGLFFSPLSPTSFASLEQPPLAYSGHLWGWAPQIRIEHRFTSFAGSEITVTSGILDPISGELPTDGNNRGIGVGEASIEPAFATHISWSKPVHHRPLGFGVGGFRARQHWQASGTGKQTTSWLVSNDWEIPTTRWASISGSLYRGKSIGVFGGGIGQSAIVTDAPDTIGGTNPQFSGLDSIGGWVQLKVQPVPKIEFNTAFGQDNPFARELGSGAAISYAGAPLVRNRTIFSNVIYRPRSDLLFSLEIRRIRGVQEADRSIETANHINMGMGILF